MDDRADDLDVGAALSHCASLVDTYQNRLTHVGDALVRALADKEALRAQLQQRGGGGGVCSWSDGNGRGGVGAPHRTTRAPQEPAVGHYATRAPRTAEAAVQTDAAAGGASLDAAALQGELRASQETVAKMRALLTTAAAQIKVLQAKLG